MTDKAETELKADEVAVRNILLSQGMTVNATATAKMICQHLDTRPTQTGCEICKGTQGGTDPETGVFHECPCVHQDALRPTQTADAVENAIRAAGNIAYLTCAKTRHIRLGTQVEQDILTLLTLSTSADSGDREEVEPSAATVEMAKTIGADWVPNQKWTPAAQDSGEAIGDRAISLMWLMEDEEWLACDASELHAYCNDEVETDPINECYEAGLLKQRQTGDDEFYVTITDKGRQFIETMRPVALRQPRNDGELLREAKEHLKNTSLLTGNLDWKADLGSLLDRIDAALARLDQGEG